MKIEFKGINGVLSDVRKYPKRVVEEIQQETRNWAERTEEAAKRDVPFDTGALQSTIRAVMGADKLTWIVKSGGINGVDYAPFIEFGTGTGVDKEFLQRHGLVNYAAQFKGANDPIVPLPARSFLYANARREFEKSFAEIKKIIDKTWKN